MITPKWIVARAFELSNSKIANIGVKEFIFDLRPIDVQEIIIHEKFNKSDVLNNIALVKTVTALKKMYAFGGPKVIQFTLLQSTYTIF